MRFRIILLVLLMATGLISHVNAAPSDEQMWYFAGTSSQIIAFTADGDRNVLLEGDEVENLTAFRFDAQTVLALINVDDVTLLYHLTPESAIPFTTSVDLSEAILTVQSQQGSHVLYFKNSERSGIVIGLLADLDTLTLEPISQNLIFGNESAFGISEDGQFLRYVRQETETSWTIREHTLATGEERVIYTIENNPYPVLMADQGGEHWLFSNFDHDTNIRTYMIINADGTNEIIAEVAGGDLVAAFGMLNTSLFVVPLACKVNCTVILQNLSEATTTTFTMPLMESHVIPYFQVDDTHLIVSQYASNAFWILRMDGTAEQIGYASIYPIFSSTDELISPDGHWLTMTDARENPTRYMVWDIPKEEFILENSFHEADPDSLQVFYSESGFTIWESSQYAFAYLDTDQAIIELPHGNERYYFEVLVDGTILYQQFTPSIGIYRYDPDTQTETLLIDGGVPLVR